MNRVCYPKPKYLSLKAANKAKKRWVKKNLGHRRYSYRCEECGHWHLTKNPPRD